VLSDYIRDDKEKKKWPDLKKDRGDGIANPSHKNKKVQQALAVKVFKESLPKARRGFNMRGRTGGCEYQGLENQKKRS